MSLTPAQIAGLKHAGLSLIVTTIIAACIAAGSYILQEGPVNWRFAGSLFVFAILLSLAHGVSEYLKADAKAQATTNPQAATTELAISDVLDGFATKLQGMFPAYSVTNALSAVPNSPLVTIHTNSPITTTTTDTVSTPSATTTETTTAPASMTPSVPSISDATTQTIATNVLKTAMSGGGNATVPF